MSELQQRSGKVQELKDTLQQLIAENPDSPEAEAWREQLRNIGQCPGGRSFYSGGLGHHTRGQGLWW